MKNLIGLIAFAMVFASVGLPAQKDACVAAARKAAAAHVREQNYFTHFDPSGRRHAVIRSVEVETNTVGKSYNVSVEYGLAGDENSDVAETAACYVETRRYGSGCRVIEGGVSCDVQ